MKTIIVLAAALLLAGCAGPNARMKTVAVGTVAGAAAGCAIGSIWAGCGPGALIGAVGGGITGAVIPLR